VQFSSASALTKLIFLKIICTEIINLELYCGSLVNIHGEGAQWFTRCFIKINRTETVNGNGHFLPDT
jgi:hypothetical protein